jgi:hypothetical protein
MTATRPATNPKTPESSCHSDAGVARGPGAVARRQSGVAQWRSCVPPRRSCVARGQSCGTRRQSCVASRRSCVAPLVSGVARRRSCGAPRRRAVARWWSGITSWRRSVGRARHSVRAVRTVAGYRAYPVGCQTARGGGENSPALECWVGGGKAGRVPQGTAGRVLPSLRDFDLRSHAFPSAQAPGYFQSRFGNQPDKHGANLRRARSDAPYHPARFTSTNRERFLSVDSLPGALLHFAEERGRTPEPATHSPDSR